MENKCSLRVMVIWTLLHVILYQNLGCLAARILLYQGTGGILGTPPTHNLNYRSETKNGAHGQIVYVNGKPESEAGTVHDKNGAPVVKANKHDGSEIGTINNPNGSPRIMANSTSGDQSGIISGSDGKPKIEAHKYGNGGINVTIYGQDGKPIYNLNYNTAPPPPF